MIYIYIIIFQRLIKKWMNKFHLVEFNFRNLIFHSYKSINCANCFQMNSSIAFITFIDFIILKKIKDIMLEIHYWYNAEYCFNNLNSSSYWIVCKFWFLINMYLNTSKELKSKKRQDTYEY